MNHAKSHIPAMQYEHNTNKSAENDNYSAYRRIPASKAKVLIDTGAPIAPRIAPVRMAKDVTTASVESCPT
jgi:uncharacterized heparinase superfamily protein